MYKINKSPCELTIIREDYFRNYKDKVRDVIRPFIDENHRESFVKIFGQRNRVSLTMKVLDGSVTCNFLLRCMNDDGFLRKVLIGSVDEQLALIQFVIKNGNLNSLKTLSQKRAKDSGWKDGDCVDDFNTIIKEIFVTRLFDSKNLDDNNLALDKDLFVSVLELRICPYCGRSYIYRVVKNGKNGPVTVKPQIDHFLPKSSYPFLALNFMNLIPCCTQCNMSPCKVDNDPLDDNHRLISKLMHPYHFDESNILFRYGLSSGDLFNPANYSVGVAYSTKDLKHGYNNFLAIDKLYAEHSQEVCNMLCRAEAFHAATNNFYKGVGVNETPFSMLSYAILGYALNTGEESRQLLYKFKKDVIMQMYNATPTGRKYYFDWMGNEGTLYT